MLRSYEDGDPEMKSDAIEFIMIIDLSYEFDEPQNLNEIKYGRMDDKDWTILDEVTATELYEKLTPILSRNTRDITSEELEIFQPYMSNREWDEHNIEIHN